MEDGIAFFHDGKQLLECVKSKMDTFRRDNDTRHKLSSRICDELVLDMLHNIAPHRMKADQVWRRAVEILNRANNEIAVSPRPLPEGKRPDRPETWSYEPLDVTPDTEAFLDQPGRLTRSPDQHPSNSPPVPGTAFTLRNENEVEQWESQGQKPSDQAPVAGPSRPSQQPPASSLVGRRHTGLGKHSTTNRYGASASSSTYELPWMTVLGAMGWMERIQTNSRHTLSPKESELKMKLNGRDHVSHELSLLDISPADSLQAFILDNSFSTHRYWEQMCNLFRIMATILQGDDPDGMELRFTTSRQCLQSNDVTQLYNLACQMKPNEYSNVEEALEKAIAPHESRLRNGDKRPLTVYIFTDGAWSEGEPDAVLLRLETLLQELELERLSLGIQFISFGDNKEGLKQLRLLDDMHEAYGLHL